MEQGNGVPWTGRNQSYRNPSSCAPINQIDIKWYVDIFSVTTRCSRFAEWTAVLAAPALRDFLMETRKTRLGTIQRDTVRSRLLLLDEALLDYYVQLPRNAEMDCHPEYVEFAFMEQCRALVDAPPSQTVTREDFAEIIPDLAQQWEVTHAKHLLCLLERELNKLVPKAKDITNLALAMYVCGCGQPIPFREYRRILTHKCTYSLTPGGLSDQRVDDFEYDSTVRTLHSHSGRSWLEARKRFYVQTHFGTIASTLKSMHRILTQLGLDPEQATIEDLDACEGRLRCQRCIEYKPRQADMVYSWEAAVSAHRDHSFGSKSYS